MFARGSYQRWMSSAGTFKADLLLISATTVAEPY